MLPDHQHRDHQKFTMRTVSRWEKSPVSTLAMNPPTKARNLTAQAFGHGLVGAGKNQAVKGNQKQIAESVSRAGPPMDNPCAPAAAHGFRPAWIQNLNCLARRRPSSCLFPLGTQPELQRSIEGEAETAAKECYMPENQARP